MQLPSASPLWVSETIFDRGDAFFSALLEKIQQARRSVELETYIYDKDPVGQRLLESLRRAARRGVGVRLLVDGVGSPSWTSTDFLELARAGIEARAFHPLPWQLRHSSLQRLLSLRRLILGIWKLNRRNHRKVCLIDGELAFVGGMNISAVQSEHESGRRALRDLAVEVRGPAVALLGEAFSQAWDHHRGIVGSSPAGAGSELVLLNRSGRERRRMYAATLERMLVARRRIWITTPYFVPDISLVRVLRFAAWSGVDVRIVVPRDNNIWGLRWAARAYYPVLLAAGVQIHEYLPSLLHAKLLLLDERALVGSTNLNHRSLLHDLEVSLELRRPASIGALERRFLEDLSHSRRIGTGFRASLAGRVFQRLALLFQRWI